MSWHRVPAAWPMRSAIFGGLVWAALLAPAIAGQLGLIELLFLLAPLVIVPLALPLAAGDDPPAPCRAAILLQPFAATSAAASFFLPAGTMAAIIASPWLLVVGLVGLTGLTRLKSVFRDDFGGFLITAGTLLVPVGGVWLLASRSGTALGGFPEPIVLLTAVHFHYTAFAGPLLTALAGRGAGSGTVFGLAYRAAGLGMTLGTPFLAAAWVFSPRLKIVSVFALVAAFPGTAILELRALSHVRRPTSRLLLVLSAAAVMAGMVLVAVFEVGSYTRATWLSIPQMARTHGLLNGVGFTLCGLVAWTLETRRRDSEPRSLATGRHREPPLRL